MSNQPWSDDGLVQDAVHAGLAVDPTREPTVQAQKKRMLDGRAVIGTGGGRGIGRAHCLELAAQASEVVLAAEQASATAVRLDGVPGAVRRDEPAPLVPEKATRTAGPDIAVSLPAYDREFDAKLRWEAGRCDACGTLALPPRRRCLSCGGPTRAKTTAVVISYSRFVDSTRESRSRARHVELRGI